jgi:hypothetical protein
MVGIPDKACAEKRKRRGKHAKLSIKKPTFYELEIPAAVCYPKRTGI